MHLIHTRLMEIKFKIHMLFPHRWKKRGGYS